jgi:hypothetical protein
LPVAFFVTSREGHAPGIAHDVFRVVRYDYWLAIIEFEVNGLCHTICLVNLGQGSSRSILMNRCVGTTRTKASARVGASAAVQRSINIVTSR